jgi:nitroreductase
LLAAEAEGLGTLFFGVFQGEDELRTELGIPAGLLLLGVVALGWPAPQPARPGTSASRPRRRPAEIIHQGRW